MTTHCGDLMVPMEHLGAESDEQADTRERQNRGGLQ